jgi:hypothetical protein
MIYNVNVDVKEVRNRLVECGASIDSIRNTTPVTYELLD